MLNVLLICSLGASTGALCDKIKKVADSENYEINIWATSLATASDEIEKSDVILLGPQIRFMLKKVAKEAGGLMDAEGILKTIKGMAKEI